MSARIATYERRASMFRAGAGAAVMVAALFALSVLTRHHVPSPAEVWAGAGFWAASTLVVAALFVRETRYPRGAYVAAAFILAGSALLTALHPAAPTRWAHETWEIAWLYPWFFLSLEASSSRRTSACASAAAARWFLPAGAALLGLAAHLPFLLGR